MSDDGNVYVVEACFDYEGCEILGVFTDEQAAIDFAEGSEQWCDDRYVSRYPLDAGSKGEVVKRLDGVPLRIPDYEGVER